MALQNTLIVDWRLNVLESAFFQHSNDFTLSLIPNWKASQQPKLLFVKARPSAKLDLLCSTFGFLVQLLVPFLVLYFRFSRATSGALSRALLSVFSCNFWCPFSCSTFGFLVHFWCSTFVFLVQLLVLFLVLYLVLFFAPRSFSCAIWPYFF